MPHFHHVLNTVPFFCLRDSQTKLEKLIKETRTRAETHDAKHRMCEVKLKAYCAELEMREQDAN